MDIDRSVLFGGLDRPTVLVMGLGESGLAIARWCAMHGCALRLADSREAPPNLAAALALDNGPHRFISVPGSPFPVETLDDGIAIVAVSPGLSPLDPDVAAMLSAAREKGIPVWGELRFFDQALKAMAPAYQPAVIAITGTNGKTTTTALTGLLVERAGRSVAVAGNISPAMLDRLAALYAAQTLPQVWVLELSSFQLDSAENFSPTVATVLNVTQDHLDWHGSFDAYAAAKFNIFGPGTRVVLNRDDPCGMAWLAKREAEARRALAAAPKAKPRRRVVDERASTDDTSDGEVAAVVTQALASPSPSMTPVTFGTDVPSGIGDFGMTQDGGLTWLAQAIGVDGDDEAQPESGVAGRRRSRLAGKETDHLVKPLMPVDALRIRGLHNASNALAALALCRGIGLPLAPLLHGLRDYRGEPHRVECIATLNGVDFVDDSKATNVGAAVAALAGLAGSIILIAGGEGKGQDFTPLKAGVSRSCKAVMLIGQDAPLVRETLADCGVPLEDHPTLEAATRAAHALAQSGDTVLLSPACASLDMFRNYAHRSEVFRRCVEEIAADQGIAL